MISTINHDLQQYLGEINGQPNNPGRPNHPLIDTLTAKSKNLVNVFRRFINGFKRPSKKHNLRLLRERNESLDSFLIRDATVDDLAELAALHVRTWNETYPEVKAAPSFQIREWQWKEQFKVNTGYWFCYVVQRANGGLIGFAKGIRRENNTGEINKIYMLFEYQRLGLGRKLVGHVVRRFLAMGIDKMILHGVPEDPSCSFHRKIGGKKMYTKEGEFHGSYFWLDLQKLASF